ncbi:hypothetical protein AVAK2825_05295 [Acidovorax sp. SUPP2825]|nr:hypothetical protein AVAK2825_05295 [Acidovorax sp. SUPP2825]
MLIERESQGFAGCKDLRPDDWHLIWPDLFPSKEPAHG